MADLCTIANVKLHMNEAAATWDTELTEIVDRVSRAMEAFVARQITLATVTGEQHQMTVIDTLVLDERAQSITSVDEAGTALTTDDWELFKGNRMLVRKTGDLVRNWPAVLVKVTYQAGWTTIPTEWVLYAVKQSRFEFEQYNVSAAKRFAETSRTGASGETVTSVAPQWLPDVEQFLTRERRTV